MNILVRELQTNPALLTETVFPPHVWKAFYQLVEAINALDPNSAVMVYLRDLIEQGYGALIETSASIKHDKVELLRSLGGLSYSTAFDQVPCGAGVYLWNAIADGSQYVGSTVNFYERTVSRIYTLTHPPYNAIAEFGLNHGGLDAWLWGIIYETPDFFREFLYHMAYYSPSYAELEVLWLLTQFMPRVLEQSLLSCHIYFKWNASPRAGFLNYSMGNKDFINLVDNSGVVLQSYNNLAVARAALGIKEHRDAVKCIRYKKVLSCPNFCTDLYIKRGNKSAR